MLSVLLRESNGHEQFHEATRVWFHPHKNEREPKTLFWSIPGEEHPMMMTDGADATVYVMNANGKTIATYHFFKPKT